jgi:hypothetical protein
MSLGIPPELFEIEPEAVQPPGQPGSR